MCPECGSDYITIEEFDFGICSQTGYHDAGERFRCGACGATGGASDLVAPSDGHVLKSSSVKGSVFLCRPTPADLPPGQGQPTAANSVP
jgi:hypothetical protein